MLVKEYRVVLPMTVDEYKIGQLYSVCQASLNETGGGEGIQVVKNESFSNQPLLNGDYSAGQYTYKIYHLQSRVPSLIRLVAPAGSLEVHEEAWNAYPYCRTILTNPGYMKENFRLTIESLHLPDRGTTENAHNLPATVLPNREVVFIDIANDAVSDSDYVETIDPTKFHSKTTGRGPLTKNWIQSCNPVMTCYKLVTVEFKWFGVQGRMENYIQRCERRLFTNFHRKLFCWIDNWQKMTLADIRAMEERVKVELEEARRSGEIRGTRIEGDIK